MKEIELLKLQSKLIAKSIKMINDLDKKVEYLTEAVDILVQEKLKKINK